MVGGSQGSQVKLSDGSVKTVTAATHLSKAGTTTLRMTGGIITATSSTQGTSAATAAAAAAASTSQQVRQTPEPTEFCVCSIEYSGLVA